MSAPARAIGGIVGRRRELASLQAWLEAARQGAGRLVLCAGEPGIGKTRLAQELAGIALAGGTTVAWGRCQETAGAPPLWPWRQVLRSLGADSDAVLAGDLDSPEDRFRLLEEVTTPVVQASAASGLLLILDDVHWGDELSLLVLRHLADHIAGTRVLLLATFRDVEPASALPGVLPGLARSPGAERLDLRGFSLAEVREQLSETAGEAGAPDAEAVLDLTGGNPLFVREIARAIAEGTWRPDRPPRSVLDLVSARLSGLSPECRRLLQAAAIAGRDFALTVVAAALATPVEHCLPLLDEAIAHGLVDRVGDTGDHRFVHALIREAVDASLTTAGRLALHRSVAEAIEAVFAGDLSEHLADIARHWCELAPYGEASTARAWTVRAADDAVRRLAYEEGVRLYRAALALAVPVDGFEHCRLLLALGRAAYLAGDLQGCLEAAVAAADAAGAVDSAELMAEAALVLEAAPDAGVNAAATRLCEQALAALGGAGSPALRARLLAQRSHLAYYDGDQDRVEALSAAALELACASGDDRAMVDAVRARKEACPGPAGRPERTTLADELITIGSRTNSPRTTMWGELWRIDALVESGRLAAAYDELSALEVAVARVGGPVSAWHLDRATAYVAQAQGRYADAAAAGRRGFERMRAVEPRPARGAYFALLCALAAHVGITDDMADILQQPIEPLPRFRTTGPLSRAVLSLAAGRPEEAAAWYQQAGPLSTWSLSGFYLLHGYVCGALAAAALGRHDDLTAILERLEPFRGENAVGEGVCSMGPVELALGRGAAALGHLDRAVDELAAAVDQADRSGARGFAAEARYHLASALVERKGAGDARRAATEAVAADRLARALGMSGYVHRTGALVAELTKARPAALSAREAEVAGLVAEGLTNRQIAERLFISERTAQNHVQHVLTKLGFSTRAQIAAWSVRRQNE